MGKRTPQSSRGLVLLPLPGLNADTPHKGGSIANCRTGEYFDTLWVSSFQETTTWPDLRTIAN